MAIAARFNFKLKQYNAVNAFVNANLKNAIYMQMPHSYMTPGKVLQLKKALYGLR